MKLDRNVRHPIGMRDDRAGNGQPPDQRPALCRDQFDTSGCDLLVGQLEALFIVVRLRLGARVLHGIGAHVLGVRRREPNRLAQGIGQPRKQARGDDAGGEHDDPDGQTPDHAHA